MHAPSDKFTLIHVERDEVPNELHYRFVGGVVACDSNYLVLREDLSKSLPAPRGSLR